jgi:hypothetical protein
MPNTKTITKKQLTVIDDLFAGKIDEDGIFEKHKINRRTYDKWLAEENFAAEFDRRIKSAHRQGELVIARYASIAALKLVNLTESKSEETSRKACLDVINYLRQKAEPVTDEQPEDEKLPDLSPELASKLLAALANTGKQQAIQD